jgi:phenylalanyl-tRNA synthetase alpha chain
MKQELQKLKEEVIQNINSASDINRLKEIETEYLGRKGKITKVLRGVKDLEEEMKREVGSMANEIKRDLQAELSKKIKDVGGHNREEFVDVTLPGKDIERGHLHPLTIVRNELEDLFRSLGFMVLDGPELESDYYCFEALNIPKHHPARDMQDTFYIDTSSLYNNDQQKKESDLLMRTHTSPVQVRGMQKYGAPFRGVAPGRVYRSEAIDACHEHTFDQMEGIMVDKDISVSNLIAVIKELIDGIFGREMETRVRPGYFPFVEPGIEVDIKCTICHGSGCPSCKNSGWLELVPAGMIHPRVLEYGGIDPNEYSGFAFGVGLTRLVMMRYCIGDIRAFNSGDMRVLEQF